MEPELRKLYLAVDRILWEDWDPIGVHRMGGPADEYASYVPQVAALVLRGGSSEEIADLLNRISSERIGIDDRESAERAAKLLVALR